MAFFKSEAALPWINRDLGFELWRRASILAYGSDEDQSELYDQLLERLREGDTNWNTITTCVALLQQSLHGETFLAVETLISILHKQSSDPEKGKERGFTLALLYYFDQLRQSSLECPSGKPLLDLFCCTSSESVEWSNSSLVKLYIERFASKACCFDDVLPYLQHIDFSASLGPLRDAFPDNLRVSVSYVMNLRLLNGLAG